MPSPDLFSAAVAITGSYIVPLVLLPDIFIAAGAPTGRYTVLLVLLLGVI